MKEEVLAGIVTRNPEMGALKRNLEAIAPQVGRVVIVDNGSANVEEIQRLAEEIQRRAEMVSAGNPIREEELKGSGARLIREEGLNVSGVKLIRNGKNKGIAFALNQIGDEAEREGMPFFLTLDQDSTAAADLAEKLAALFSDPAVGGASPYIDVGDPEKSVRKTGVEEIPTAISSGCMVRTELWKKIGGFWDFLFIDEVDHEFCFQIRRQGYKIVRRHDTAIIHELGETFVKTVFGHKFTPNNHSAFRRYYIARNNVILAHLYPEEKGAFAHRYRMLFRMMISILVCEEKKEEKIRAILRGIRDGWAWNRKHSAIESRRGFGSA